LGSIINDERGGRIGTSVGIKLTTKGLREQPNLGEALD